MAEEQLPSLRELLAIAQTALEEGRHQEATVACRHVLRDYPDSVTAMRLLGESYLEAGRADEAVRAFEKVLGIDPFNVLARVGLGVLAEDRGEDERAIAQFRLAWEVAPTLPQLRSELVRLYRKRYGVGGRLRMTRVALANLHAHNEDLPRAIRQFQLLHAEEPARPDVTIGLAEALWRHGDRDDATTYCQQLLAERPRLVRPLLILAALHGDGERAVGSPAAEADELLATARTFDPDAVLARELLALQPSATLQRFIDAPVPMAPFDPATLDIAGTDELLGAQTGTLGEGVVRWEDVAGGFAGAGMSTAPAPPIPTNELTPTASDEDDVEALFAAIDRQLSTVNIDEELPSFVPSEEDRVDVLAEDAEDAEPLASWETGAEDAMTPAPDELTAVERLTANWDNIDNELAAARPSDDLPVGVTGMLGGLELDFQPFDAESDAEPAMEETMTFDPAKFSLPPLDGEDDDDEFALDLDADELGADITPFNLDEAGPKIKTGGLTFAELVRTEGDTPITYASGNSFADPLDGDDALAGIASIFATRELAPLPEDRLLELQARPGEMAPQETSPPTAALPTFAMPTDSTMLLDTAALGVEDEPTPAEPAALDGHVGADHPAATAALEANTTTDDTPVPPPATPEAKPAISFEALLGADTPRLELPEATFYPDATRPLLLDETNFFERTPPTASGTPKPDAGEEVGMDHLFSRLRHRKQERIETGELQIDRRATPAPRSPLIPSDLAAPTVGPSAQEGAGGEVFDSVTMDEASLDEWIMSLSPTEMDDAESDDAIVIHGDDWFSDMTEVSSQDTALDAPLATADLTDGSMAEDEVADLRWGGMPAAAVPVDLPEAASAPAPAEREIPWAELVPDEPQPIANQFVRDEVASVESMPPQVPEMPAPREPRWEPLAVAATNGVHAYANGHHPAAPTAPTAPVAPAYSPVFAAPPPMVAERPNLMRQDQAEQRAILESLVAADPTNHFARLTLAVAYGNDHPEQALTEYRRLIKESDELVPEVIERLKEMIADGNAPTRAHRILGDAYMKLGQFDLAMAEFQRALSTRPRGTKP
ncbi:MAG TPA: tetratricopeptide repeat protein [Thermomicrobiales bacterium]|jgi:tetratricopeptide (TPR) repeat protein